MIGDKKGEREYGRKKSSGRIMSDAQGGKREKRKEKGSDAFVCRGIQQRERGREREREREREIEREKEREQDSMFT